ncbi:two-component sensor histidine kinase [Acrocarpospora pleiomorpha]|uniref:histidine kinase n=2 Tax=Acrocarpospora pleiomorpha TaxID=90975 RepID=A0A5M3XG44_9ACTN|nr:two-component sensor histidine kinase [Acrocarpospora pleiomorpha]
MVGNYARLMRWRQALSRVGAVDYLIAGAVGLFAVTEELIGGTDLPERPSLALWVAAGIVTALLVLVRRLAPFGVMAVYTGMSLAVFLLAGQEAGAWQWYTQLFLLFTLLSEVPLASPKGLFGPVATALFLAGMAISYHNEFAEYAIAVSMVAIAGGAGFGVRRHRMRALSADRRSETLAAQSELLVKEAVAEEQARLARELHDIVAHSVSLMVMQAGGVRRMLRDDQTRERAGLALIEETGRGAVEELRRMLHLLRGPGTDGLTPLPGLARLEDLVEQARSAGLDVEVDVAGEPVPLPAGLDLSAYRIVQESLTNALKHAGPTAVTVTIGYRPNELSLDITDAGPRDGARGAPAATGGHGLIGMRERAALFRGDLTAGPHGSGFAVRAALPLSAR